MNDPAYNNSVFWIEVEKIKPNPFQPRKEFNQEALNSLADSIRQYGVLQPLVVTRQEIERDDGLMVEYEIIAGERRWRASRIAGLSHVPAIIRTGEQTDKMKLEMAIIENLQREDLNPIDRAKAFQQLAKEFNLKHGEIAKKVGRSREYVSNTIRLLVLPQEILDAIMTGKITEGHGRPILMLSERPEEQMTLFKEIMIKKMTVREAENISKRIATERVRKKEIMIPPEILEMEEKLSDKFGTRVRVEKKEAGGKVTIDFFSEEDLEKILTLMAAGKIKAKGEQMEEKKVTILPGELFTSQLPKELFEPPAQTDDDLYAISRFSL
ncbi:MAG: ParB/RepB/Spo0J family partition protein [Patescibacteria group bacterium]